MRQELDRTELRVSSLAKRRVEIALELEQAKADEAVSTAEVKRLRNATDKNQAVYLQAVRDRDAAIRDFLLLQESVCG